MGRDATFVERAHLQELAREALGAPIEVAVVEGEVDPAELATALQELGLVTLVEEE